LCIRRARPSRRQRRSERGLSKAKPTVTKKDEARKTAHSSFVFRLSSNQHLATKGRAMHTWTISQEDHPSPEDVRDLYDAIVAYNNAQVGDHWTGRLNIFARDQHGQIIGGIYGFTDRGWLRIEVLVVKDGWRGLGVGTRLLAVAEDEGRARGCHDAWLDTFSFQALPFYQQHGYAIFGALENYPTGHSRYFVRKAL
jgi:GNAT superfamily N-acetyltransferase